jgi:hypothetical protein
VPIAVDATTPAIVTGTGASVTTASFTAPANSLLVALCAIGGGTGIHTVSNSGTALTWVTQVNHQLGEDSGAFSGTARVVTAIATTSVARTVTLTPALSGVELALKLLVVTGADITGTPVGAVGENHSTTANLTPTVYTSTVDNSRAVGIGVDASAGGSPTSSDTGFAWHLVGGVSGIAVYKAADTTPAATAVTLNFNGTGATRSWNWAAIEILPLVTPFVAPRPLVLGQAVNRAATY